MGPRLIAARDRAGRAVQRKALRKLRDRQIKPATLTRYLRASALFYAWATTNFGFAGDCWESLDQQAAEYIDHLWNEGEARGLACDTLCGIQHLLLARPVFCGSWRLHKN